MVHIRSSAAIQQDYNAIADLCRQTQAPVYLTKDGVGDLVVMDVETYGFREKMLELRENLLAVEEARAAGARDYNIDEAVRIVDEAIAGAAHDEQR
jgi:PHD/YefM family antitoxin component YafN of YafNO toxin-antitoxin module